MTYVVGFDDSAGNTTSAAGLTGVVLAGGTYPGGALAWDTTHDLARHAQRHQRLLGHDRLPQRHRPDRERADPVPVGLPDPRHVRERRAGADVSCPSTSAVSRSS